MFINFQFLSSAGDYTVEQQMLNYADLYELVRKEKYSETLQQLPNDFVSGMAAFLEHQRGQLVNEGDAFLDGPTKSKKQLENSLSLFKELMLRRKKKLLNLVFVASETGILKRDYEMMLPVERAMFDTLVKAFEEGDKEVMRLLNGTKHAEQKGEQRALVTFQQDTEQFVDMSGNIIGPFKKGELAHLDATVSLLLVESGKARAVDEP